MTTIPDGMPVISLGAHEDPSKGACIMEYVSYLAGEEFTDHPACADSYLANFMRRANDDLTTDEARARLIPFIPAVLGSRARVTEYRTATFGPPNTPLSQELIDFNIKLQKIFSDGMEYVRSSSSTRMRGLGHAASHLLRNQPDDPNFAATLAEQEKHFEGVHNDRIIQIVTRTVSEFCSLIEAPSPVQPVNSHHDSLIARMKELTAS